MKDPQQAIADIQKSLVKLRNNQILLFLMALSNIVVMVILFEILVNPE